VKIAAYMAALNIADLDHMTKAAVLAVCARSNQRTGVARVSIDRLAQDLGVHYETARRALNRAVDAGYLTVDKSPGRVPAWKATSRAGQDHPPHTTGQPPAQRATKDKEGYVKDGAAPLSASGAVDNLPSRDARFYPGTGWVKAITPLRRVR
jgi:hypothetical protein